MSHVRSLAGRRGCRGRHAARTVFIRAANSARNRAVDTGRSSDRGAPVLLAVRSVAVVAACLVFMPGCATSHFQFVADHRLHIRAPRQRTTVSLPVTMRWSYEDFRVTGPDAAHDPGAGYFAVFVDRTPVPAGKDLRWLARDDRACRAADGCPNAEYFTTRWIFTSTQPEMTFNQLPRPGRHHGPETHTIIVVLLDGSGHRVGESAWYVDFKLHRDQS